MLTPSDIALAEKICAEATPEPWSFNYNRRKIYDLGRARRIVKGSQEKPLNIAEVPMRDSKYPITHEQWEANAEFMSESRRLLPLLLQDRHELVDCMNKLLVQENKLIEKVERYRGALEKAQTSSEDSNGGK